MGFDMRWEYKVIKFSKRSFFSGTIDPEAFEAELNNLGRDGWELVSVTQNQMAISVNEVTVFEKHVNKKRSRVLRFLLELYA
jgi:hypothetical protein